MRRETIFLVALGAVPILWASWRLARYRDWNTGPHRLHWVYEDGSPVPPDPNGYWKGCQPNDIGLDALLHAGRLWTMCDDPVVGENIGYAVLDPENRRGRIFRLTRELRPINTIALARAGPDSVAIVFRVDSLSEGGLAYGVLGPGGWVVEPSRVPESEAARVLAFVPEGDGFALFVEPRGWVLDGTTAAAWKFVGLKTLSVEKKFPGPIDCGKCRVACGVVPSKTGYRIAYWNEGRHRAYGFDGEFVVSDTELCAPYEFMADNVHFGVLRLPNRSALGEADAVVRSREGILRPDPPPSLPGLEPFFFRTFEFTDGVLVRRRSWLLKRSETELARRLDSERWLLSPPTEALNDTLELRVSDDQLKVQQRRVVARAPSFNCGELWGGHTLADGDGGFFLVSQAGCVLRVDSELRRLDPYPLLGHLRARGSLSPSWDEREHEWKLLWILLGLPVLVIPALLLARARRFPKERSLRVATVVYLASAAWCAIALQSILR